MVKGNMAFMVISVTVMRVTLSSHVMRYGTLNGCYRWSLLWFLDTCRCAACRRPCYLPPPFSFTVPAGLRRPLLR